MNGAHVIPYSLKFLRLKVFAGYDCTTNILSCEFVRMHAIHLWEWPLARACTRSTAIDRGRVRFSACMLVPIGCRYRR